MTLPSQKPFHSRLFQRREWNFHTLRFALLHIQLEFPRYTFPPCLDSLSQSVEREVMHFNTAQTLFSRVEWIMGEWKPFIEAKLIIHLESMLLVVEFFLRFGIIGRASRSWMILYVSVFNCVRERNKDLNTLPYFSIFCCGKIGKKIPKG